MSAPHRVRRPRRRGHKDRHYTRNCVVCGKKQFGTRVSLDNHESNCLKQKSPRRMSA